MSNLRVVGWIMDAAANSYSSSKSSSSKSSNSKSSSSSEHKDSYNGRRTRYWLEQHIYQVISEIPELHSFFKKLNRYGKEIDNIDKDKNKENIQNIAKEYVEEASKCEELMRGLEEIGIIMNPEIRGKEHFGGVKTNNHYGYGGKGDYSYNTDETFCIGFNGIKITREMLEDKDLAMIYF